MPCARTPTSLGDPAAFFLIWAPLSFTALFDRQVLEGSLLDESNLQPFIRANARLLKEGSSDEPMADAATRGIGRPALFWEMAHADAGAWPEWNEGDQER